MKEKINILQGGRAIAALAVLLMHATLLVDRGSARPQGWAFFDWGQLGVDFFFVLSGFIILYAHRNDRRGRMSGLRYAWRRVTRVYVPYLPLVLAIIALYLMAPSVGADKQWSLFTSLTLVPTEWPPAHALSVAWTLSHEMAFYAIFLLSYITRKFRWLIAAWIVLIAAAACLPTDIRQILPNPVQAIAGVLLAPINLEFIAGMLAAVAVRSLSRAGAEAALAVGVLGVVAFFMIDGSHRVWFGVATAFVIAGLVRLEMEGSISVPEWLVFLGNASYAIYLIHGPVITVASRVFAGFSLPSPVNMALCSIMGLVCGVLYHVLFERPALSYVRRWRNKWIAVNCIENVSYALISALQLPRSNKRYL